MNEFIFFFHILLALAFVFAALRFGRGALIAFIALQGVLANLFVVKQMSLFGFAVTCSDVFAISGILSLNLLQEYFGKEAAKEAVRSALIALLFFALMAQVHLLYIPTSADFTHDAFSTVFSSSPRIVFASIATFYIVQQCDIRFFRLLKGRLPFRISLSLVASQLLDTALFSFLGLYGLVASVFDVFWVSFFIKCVVIAVHVPFIAFSKRFVRHDLPI